MSARTVAEQLEDGMVVPREIARQIGGRALFMLGARGTLVGSPDSLRFQVKGSPKRVAFVTVRLDPSDTYTVEFWRAVRGGAPVLLRSVGDVYNDALRFLLERETGLAVSL